MGMEFESKKAVSAAEEAERARIAAEAEKIAAEAKALREENAANTQRIKDLQNIMADMVEGGEA